ncbi:MAG: alpha/beta hydrolase, partial [Acidobacteria bacterium]|nr:alpha/beta hydrolase [Acidobacteriota bacterium]
MNRVTIPACMFACILLAAIGTQAAKDPWKDQSVRVGDIKIHYLDAGSGGRTIVFVPGLTMIAEVWREQIPYFA